MRRILAIAARFLLFHFLSVLVTAIIVAATFLFLIGIFDHPQLKLWSQPTLALWNFIFFCAQITLTVGPFLLLPSALGWWAVGALLDKLGRADNARPALQGASAGLAAFIAFWTILVPIFPSILGVPIGAFFGWLVYRKLWPNLPTATRDQTTA